MNSLSIAERHAILKDHEGWFGSATPEFQAAVLSRCEWREVMAGQTLYHASDPQADPCGIVDGTVEIYSRFGAGDNPMLHLLHEGAWVGYGSALRGLPPRVTAVARTKVLLAYLPGRVLQDLLRVRPEWWRFVAQGVLEYGDTAMSAYADSLLPDGDRRCASTLLRISGLQFPRRSRPDRPSIAITQDELATLVHVSRTTLLQMLRRFEDQGLVEQAYRSLRILNASGLERIAAGTGS